VAAGGAPGWVPGGGGGSAFSPPKPNTVRRGFPKPAALLANVGFDVIPTDCAAACLIAALPDATRLALGFRAVGARSPGTARTSIEGMRQGARVRRNGAIVAEPLGKRTRMIDFGTGTKLAVSIPWGDVATAYFTTGIANIEVYVPASPRSIARMRRLDRLRPLLRLPLVSAVAGRID
jgi:short subunit dehydrogenase-like uncharacterized protein